MKNLIKEGYQILSNELLIDFYRYYNNMKVNERVSESIKNLLNSRAYGWKYILNERYYSTFIASLLSEVIRVLKTNIHAIHQFPILDYTADVGFLLEGKCVGLAEVKNSDCMKHFYQGAAYVKYSFEKFKGLKILLMIDKAEVFLYGVVFEDQFYNVCFIDKSGWTDFNKMAKLLESAIFGMENPNYHLCKNSDIKVENLGEEVIKVGEKVHKFYNYYMRDDVPIDERRKPNLEMYSLLGEEYGKFEVLELSEEMKMLKYEYRKSNDKKKPISIDQVNLFKIFLEMIIIVCKSL